MKQVEDAMFDIDDDISFVRTCLLARSRRLKFLWLAIIGLLALGTQQVLVSGIFYSLIVRTTTTNNDTPCAHYL